LTASARAPREFRRRPGCGFKDRRAADVTAQEVADPQEEHALNRPGPTFVATAMRRRYERAQGLEIAGQIREVVDYLENPEVLVAEFVDAYCAIEGCADADELILEDVSTSAQVDALSELIAPGQDLPIDGSPLAPARCMSGPVPLLAEPGDALRRGLDYVAMIPGSVPTPVLGVVERLPGTTPYTLLMRGLCCLAEVAPAPHLERVNEKLFKRGLVAGARFELHLLLRHSPASEAERTLAQLTRDLAEGFRQAIADEWQFPDLLSGITCLRLERDARRPAVDWIA
jgi:hypothetical protein